VAGTGKSRIALDVGADAVFFDNPDLPLTRSEMALPLKIGEEVIGVLDVQSVEPAAFTDEDVAILQTMADQVALAIENARLLEESRQALEELRSVYGEQLRQTWAQPQAFLPSLVYDRLAVTPAEPEPLPPAVEDALQEGRMVAISEPDNGRAAIAAPLRLWDQIIGAIVLEETDEARPWTEDEITLVETVSQQVSLALESARLYQMEQRRRFIADTLQEIARVVGSTLDLQEVTTRLLDQLERLIPFDTAIIHLIRGEQREILGGRGINLEAARKWLQGQPPLSQDPLLSEVIRTHAPVIVADTRTDPRWKRPGARSGMAIPLLLADQVIGLLLVDHRQPGMYDEETARLAGAVASQAAIAIQNARLYAEAEQTARQMQALYDTSRVLSASLEEKKVLQAILETVSRLLECEFALIALVDEAEGTIGLRYGIWKGQYNVFPEWISMARYPLDHPDIIADVYRTGRTEVIAGWDERFNREIYEKFGHERLLRVFMPIRLRERTLGVIEIGYDRATKILVTEEEINLLRALVDQAAVALTNARLYAEAQERAYEQEGLARIAALAVSTLELEELLRGVLQEAVPLVEAEGCVLFLYDETAHALQPAQVLFRGNFLTDLQWQIPIDAPGMEQSIFRRGGTYYSNTGPGDPNIIPAYQPYIERLEARNLCGVALRVQDQSIGELYFINRPSGFGRDEVRLAQAIAGYLANALANARLLREIRLRAEELAALNELGQTLTARLNVEEVVEAAYRGAARLLDTTNFYIAFYTPESQTVSFPLAVEKGERRSWRSRQGGNGLTEYVIRTRAPLLIRENVPQRLKELGVDMIGEPAYSWLGVPLMIGDRVLGVIAVQSYTPKKMYTPHDQDLMTAIASQVAIALQNARSFAQTQEALAETEVLYRASAELNAAQTYQEILDVLCRYTILGQADRNVTIDLFDRPWTA
jgi:GAF domain-containing protein